MPSVRQRIRASTTCKHVKHVVISPPVIRVYAYLRCHADKDIAADNLEKNLLKCLEEYATGMLDMNARNGHKGHQYYARLNHKKRMQFSRALVAPQRDEYVSVFYVEVPAAAAKVPDGSGLHVSIIYTSDKGNKYNKTLRSI